MVNDPSQPDPSRPDPSQPDPAARRPRRSVRRRFTAAGLSLALVGGGLAAAAYGQVGPFGGAGTRSPGGTAGATGSPRTSTVAYAGFPDCRALLAYLTKHGRTLVGPYGLPGTGGIAFARGAAEDTLGGAPAAAPASGGDGSAAPDTRSGTGTNVQVAGVDEADLAKRVGDLLFSAAPSDGQVVTDQATPDQTTPDQTTSGGPGQQLPALTIVRTRDGRSTLLGRLSLRDWQPTTLLVDGDTVLLIGGAPAAAPSPLAEFDPPGGSRAMPYWNWPQRTRLVQVDVADPTAPRVVRSLVVDGSSVGARLVDGVARIAVSGATNRLRFPGPAFAAPDSPVSSDSGTVILPPDQQASTEAERRATAANRRIIAASGIEDWLPTYQLTEGGAETPTRSGALLSCADVAAPSRFSGLDTMSLLTFDLRDPAGISRWDGAGVVASGAQLYATADHTYIATSQWQNWGAMPMTEAMPAMRSQRSQIHLFDTTGGASPVYQASGEVPGFLLSQFSMDEHEGYLRVASTTAPAWWGGSPEVPSSSQVTVLRVADRRLARVGSVGGLGKTETIRAVRFLGDVGYVVTFRQTDPLYTIDLREPARPRVAGELKILGYSAYLHPVGDGLVLGIGQDADKAGRTKGLQLSLFDVADPAAPRRVDTVTMPGAWTDVEGDHHAFTFADGLALVPFTRWTDAGVAESVPVPAPGPEATGGGSDPAGGSSGSSDPAVGKLVPVQTFDAGVVAVRLAGSGTDRRFADPVVLRAVGDGPLRIDPNTGAVGPTPLRTFVGDGSIWTVTTGGVAAHDEQTLDRTDFTKL